MSHGTGEHTTLTAKAHAAVVDDIARRGGVKDLARRRGRQVRGRGGECLGGRKTYRKSTGGNGRAAAGQKVASQNFLFILLIRFGGFSHRSPRCMSLRNALPQSFSA